MFVAIVLICFFPAIAIGISDAVMGPTTDFARTQHRRP